jgi:hypothetical protein
METPLERQGIALILGRQHIDGVSPMLWLAETFPLAFFRWRIWSCAFPAAVHVQEPYHCQWPG